MIYIAPISLKRTRARKSYVIFPPHLTNASALPKETRNPEIASFCLNAVCFLPKTQNIVKNIT